MLKKYSTVLFQGDSVTDAGRSRLSDKLLGNGYPAHVRNLLESDYPDLKVKILNRGISGNRAVDLLNRWDEDCLMLKPDYVSILIGVNDTWRRYDKNDPTSPEIFKERYKKIIEKTLTGTCTQIVLLNPFLLDVNEKNITMREDLCFKQEVVAALAKEYDTKFLDLDKIFEAAAKEHTAAYYAEDGVHPTNAGHALIAKEWLTVWD